MSDTMTVHEIRGSFAPPLTDELIAQYKELILDAPPEIADGMKQLMKCVDQWWGLPDSQGTDVRAHGSGMAAVVPLEDGIKDALYDAIPWEHELAMLSDLFETIDSDKTSRHSERLVEWYDQVNAALSAKLLPNTERVKKWLPLIQLAENLSLPQIMLDGLIKLVVGMSLADWKAAQDECHKQFIQAKQGNHPDFPNKPVCEPVLLRNAAKHLLWHVRELNLDREPITSDKLVN